MSKSLAGPIALSLVAACAAFTLVGSPARVVAATEDPPASQPAAKDPVDFRKLKELLPDKVGELKRANANGSKQSMGEMKISQAEGDYSEEGKDSNAKVTIMDYGAMPGWAQGMAAWSQMEIDNESDTEYSKTEKVGDYKAYEEYNKTDKSGKLTILVGSRFLVTIEVTALPAETLKATADAMKLKDVAALDK